MSMRPNRNAAAPVIETKRLHLRPLAATDLDAFHTMYADPLVYKYLTGKPLSREDAWQRMLRLSGLWLLMGYGYWALQDKITGQLAGIAGFAEFHRTITPSIDGKPEFGWALASPFHGKRLSTEAVQAIQAWGDQELHAPVTSCIIHAQNTVSLHLAKKIGFKVLADGSYNGDPTHVLLREQSRTV
jgi:RimJ/RimL family protein N-acetyltransferase